MDGRDCRGTAYRSRIKEVNGCATQSTSSAQHFDPKSIPHLELFRIRKRIFSKGGSLLLYHVYSPDQQCARRLISPSFLLTAPSKTTFSSTKWYSKLLIRFVFYNRTGSHIVRCFINFSFQLMNRDRDFFKL